MNAERNCDGCGEKIRFKQLAKIRGKYYCKVGLNCAGIIRKNHRAKTIGDAHLEEDLKRLDNKIKSENKAVLKPVKSKKPIVLEKKDIKKGSKKKSHNSLALGMSQTDKQFLFKQKIKEGMSYEEADKHVRELQEYLKDLGKTLRANKKLSEADKQKHFQEEFEKLRYS
jgi:hypothetical protein